MFETTSSSSAQSAANDSIGDYFLKQLLHSRSPCVESEQEEMPTELDTLNSSGGFSVVGADKLSVSYPNADNHGHDVGVVQANRPAPRHRLVYYFEMFVKNAGTKGQVSIGFTTAGFKLRRQPGWDPESIGYHGDDGMLYRGDGRKPDELRPYKTGATVGAGINYWTQEFFFTLDGLLVGSVNKEIKGQVFPTVAVHSQYEEVNVNFGQNEFVYDLKAYVAEQRKNQQMMIDAIEIPPDFNYRLVRNYLQHYGYEETLTSLDKACESAPTPETEFDREGTKYDLNKRRILRQQIRSGDIDAVLSNIQKWYPRIIEDEKSPICCLLQCQKFIELVREKKPEDSVKYSRKEFVKFNSELERELLKDAAVLIAYEVPEDSPVAYLLQESQKELLADAVNAMILSTYPDIKDEILVSHSCRHSTIDRLIRQVTSCVAEKRFLNADEGEGFHLHRILNSGIED